MAAGKTSKKPNDFVTNKEQVYLLGRRAHKAGKLPSEMMGIRNVVLAFQFDETVHVFAMHIEAELAKCKSATDRRIALNRLLGIKTPQKKISLASVSQYAHVTPG